MINNKMSAEESLKRMKDFDNRKDIFAKGLMDQNELEDVKKELEDTKKKLVEAEIELANRTTKTYTETQLPDNLVRGFKPCAKVSFIPNKS